MDQRMKWIGMGVAVALLTVGVHAQSGQTAPATVKPKSTAAPRDAKAGTASGKETQSGHADGSRNSGHATETIEYKDPEDMTTRYRPGNNKTAKTSGGSDSGSSAAAHAEAKQAGIPACDGASKDAAKCAPANSGAQNDKHVNKVDSFTVKQ